MDLGSPSAFCALAITVFASCAIAFPLKDARQIATKASFFTATLLYRHVRGRHSSSPMRLGQVSIRRFVRPSSPYNQLVDGWTPGAARTVHDTYQEDASMDPIRRKLLKTGAAATAMAAAPRMFAQQAGQGGAGMSFYEKGPVRIHYEQAGSGFPLLLIAGGGLNSTISALGNPFNPIEEFKGEYRCIASDLRNA